MKVRLGTTTAQSPEVSSAAISPLKLTCEAVTFDDAVERARPRLACGCGMQLGGTLARAGAATVQHGGFVTGPTLAGADAALLQTGVPATDVEKALAPKLDGLVQTFKEIHAAPELSEVEPKTAERVAKRLEELGYAVTRNFGQYADPAKPIHSVVAVFENGPGPKVLIRADMDALPIKEDTGLPYASTNDGVMHACGHDAHTTCLLGTADLLMQLKDRWSGTVLLVAQPAEEKGTGGRAMVQTGKLYDTFGKPDFAIGLHTHPEHPAGSIRATPGFVMANVDSVDVTMRGRGGHGAFPHLNVDPVLMTANFLVQLQELVSRETRPGEPAVVTAGTIAGGTARNIIPDNVLTQFTVRSFNDATRKKLLDGITRVANGVAMAAGAPADKPPIVTRIEDFTIPAVYNNPELTARLKNLWASQMSDVGEMQAMMGGDDFTYFSLPDHSVPAVYFFVGATDPAIIEENKRNGTPIPPAHSSKFVVMPEPTLKSGIVAMVTAATSLMPKAAAATSPTA